MHDIFKELITPGKIIGLGESSHGSFTEFKWKHDLILKSIKNNPDLGFTLYFEIYKEPINELVDSVKNSREPLAEAIKRCLNQSYKIWQTKEMYKFLLSIMELISGGRTNIELYGVDFDNENTKKTINQNEMLMIRNNIMFENIKKNYQKNTVHFFSAHNLHVGRYCDNCKEVGQLLTDEFKSNYISIAQHVSYGVIRAKRQDGIYDEVKFSYKDIPNSVTALSKQIFKENKMSQIFLMPTSDLENYKINIIEQCGFSAPTEEPWIMSIGSKHFDYLVLHKESQPTHGLTYYI